MMEIPDEINDICTALLNGLKDILKANLHGVYLYGAIAFPDGGAITDIDLHIILKEPLTSDVKSKLLDLHDSLRKEFPLIGTDLDAHYILLADTVEKSPPKHQVIDGVRDEAWALHREHIRAGRCIVLYGPDSLEVFPPASWDELIYALNGELHYVENHLDKYPAYCVLNLCRLMYSYKTRDVVVSKRWSAKWAIDNFPEWKVLIDTAVKSYDNKDTSGEESILKSDVKDFLDFAHKQIDKSKTS